MALYIFFLLFPLGIIMATYLYKLLLEPGRKVPGLSNNGKHILTLPATILVQKLQRGELKSEQIMRAFIDRIREVNGLINAVVQERFQAALAEAREVDDHLLGLSEDEKTELFRAKVLYGVPFTCKESFAFKEFAQTGGLVQRKNYIPDQNCEVVQRLLDAGAILLAATNVSELCMWWESSNCLYGRSRNPYNSAHIVGGSSGGEAAIIAAGGSLIGIGSDIGGSIRMPAFFNGVFGHKPSPFVVSNIGQFPVVTTEESKLLLATGPICRYAIDLKIMLKVMTADENFANSMDATVDVSKLKFYSIDHCGSRATKVCAEMIASQEAVSRILGEKLGITVQKINLPHLDYALYMWFMEIAAMGGDSFSERLLGGKPGNVYWQFVKWLVGLSDHTLPALRLAGVEPYVKKFTPKSFSDKMLKKAEDLREEVQKILGSDGILLFPSHPTTASRHHLPLFNSYNFVYTAILNVLHLPVTQVPLGLDSKGLPLGIQVASARNNDRLTLAVAEELEKQFGGWVQP